MCNEIEETENEEQGTIGDPNQNEHTYGELKPMTDTKPGQLESPSRQHLRRIRQQAQRCVGLCLLRREMPHSRLLFQGRC